MNFVECLRWHRVRVVVVTFVVIAVVALVVVAVVFVVVNVVVEKMHVSISITANKQDPMGGRKSSVDVITIVLVIVIVNAVVVIVITIAVVISIQAVIFVGVTFSRSRGVILYREQGGSRDPTLPGVRQGDSEECS